MKLKGKQQETEYLMRDKIRYKKVSLTVILLCKTGHKCTKTLEQIEFFVNVMNSLAPLKNIEVKRKKSTKMVI